MLFFSVLIVFPCLNVLAGKQLTERQALDVLAAQIQKDKLYDGWATLSCLLFSTEEKTKDISTLPYAKNTVGSVRVIRIHHQ